MGTVSLATYTHDPRGGLLEPIRERMPLLKGIYDELTGVLHPWVKRRKRCLP